MIVSKMAVAIASQRGIVVEECNVLYLNDLSVVECVELAQAAYNAIEEFLDDDERDD